MFKRRIDAEALFMLDVPRILELAKHPAGDGIPTVRTPSRSWRPTGTRPNGKPPAAAEARAAVRRDFGTADTRAPRYFVDFFRFGVDEGERHHNPFRCAAWLTEQGAPPSLVSALLTEPGRDDGLSPKDVERQIAVRHRTRPPATGHDGRSAAGRRPPTPMPTRTPSSAGRSGTRPTRCRPARTDFLFGANVDPTAEGGPAMTPTFTTGADLFGSWFADVERGEPPVRFKLADPFAALDVRPGRLILFGGAPGSGKTAALLQMGIDLLRLNESARLLVANVEMSPALLVERIASRLSAVPLTAIADRTLTPDELGRVRAAVASLEPVGGRLAFLHAPFALEHLAAAGTAFGANVLILDYVQRFTVGDGSKDKREQLETAATVLRRFCDAGAAVLVASAVARQKHAGGSTYRGLNLASFRGSSRTRIRLRRRLPARSRTKPAESCSSAKRTATGPWPTCRPRSTRPPRRSRRRPSGLDGFDAATPAPTRGKKAKGG